MPACVSAAASVWIVVPTHQTPGSSCSVGQRDGPRARPASNVPASHRMLCIGTDDFVLFTLFYLRFTRYESVRRVCIKPFNCIVMGGVPGCLGICIVFQGGGNLFLLGGPAVLMITELHV